MADFTATVAIGESLAPVGRLRFTQTGPRQFSSFTYESAGLNEFEYLTLSNDACRQGALR